MVLVIETTLVVPSEETPSEKLYLSNLERILPPNYTCTVYFYKNNGANDFFSVEVMKAALAKTLALFYPLAGRLVVGSNGSEAIDCNAEGALLVVARSELSSEDIDFQPSPELRSQFVPKPTSQSVMLMVQVTYLKCGGVVLGSATNLVFVDGRSAFHFFQTFAQIARGDLNSVIPPSFDNTPLHARSPPTITFEYPEYESNPDHQAVIKNKMIPLQNSCVTTKLKISKEQISFLKSQCTSEEDHMATVSTFCVVSALLWKCYCIAQDIPVGTETKLNFTADVRKRIQPPLPEKFFGKAVIRKSAIAEASSITSKPLYVVAKTVKASIDGITDEYIRSFIDYIEIELNQGKIITPVVELSKSILRITNITAMPVYEADFGWGAPQVMTWAHLPVNNAVYLMNEPEKDAGVMAFVLLDSETMHKFEKAFYEEISPKNFQS